VRDPRPKAQPQRQDLPWPWSQLNGFLGSQVPVPHPATHQHRLEGAIFAPLVTIDAVAAQQFVNKRILQAVVLVRLFSQSPAHCQGSWSSVEILQDTRPDHPDVATDLNNLAGLLRATNRLGEAEPLYRRGVQILIEFRRRTGYEHPNFRAGRANYSDLLEALGITPDQIEQQLDELIRSPRSEGY
jgi:hypothetical protein